MSGAVYIPIEQDQQLRKLRKYTTTEIYATIFADTLTVLLAGHCLINHNDLACLLGLAAGALTTGWFVIDTCRRWREMLEWLMHGDDEEE